MSETKKKYRVLADFYYERKLQSPTEKGNIQSFDKLSDADLKMLVDNGFLQDIEVIVEKEDNSKELQKNIDDLNKLNAELTEDNSKLKKDAADLKKKLEASEKEVEKLKKTPDK